MLRIRLQRKGRRNRPFYRIVVAEHSNAVKKEKFVKIVGHYDPLLKDVTFNKEEILIFLKNGAKPSDTVARLGLKNGIEEFEQFVKKRFSHPKKDKGQKTA